MPACEIGLCPKGFYVVSRRVAGREDPHQVNQVIPLDRFGQNREPFGAGGRVTSFYKQDHPPGETGKRLVSSRTEPNCAIIDDEAGGGVCLR